MLASLFWLLIPTTSCGDDDIPRRALGEVCGADAPCQDGLECRVLRFGSDARPQCTAACDTFAADRHAECRRFSAQGFCAGGQCFRTCDGGCPDFTTCALFEGLCYAY